MITHIAVQKQIEKDPPVWTIGPTSDNIQITAKHNLRVQEIGGMISNTDSIVVATGGAIKDVRGH